MYDICIVGAGIAGASLAAVLGKRGFNIALIDRNWDEPDEIIGELLQPGGVRKLKDMGLGNALNDIDAQPIKGYAVQLEKDWLTLSYEQENDSSNDTGFGFRYGRFVQSLRKLCRAQKNVDLIHGNVLKLMDDQGRIIGVSMMNRQGDSQHIYAKLTIVCQGSMSTLGRSLNKSRIKVNGFMVGLILKNSALPYDQHGHIILAVPSPVLSYPVAKDKIRVLIDFPGERSAPKGSARSTYLLEKILPQLPVQLHAGFREAVLEGGLKTKPTCLLASRPVVKQGVILLGDSLNMRHPITGGGMTVALTDVKALSDKLYHPEQLNNKAGMQELIYGFYRQRHNENATINILAYALYSVFKHHLLKKACFNYLKKGGIYAMEPVSILSGKSRKRIILYRHFFAVAGYALFHLNKMRTGPVYSGIIQSINALLYSVRILIPLVIDEIPRIHRKRVIRNSKPVHYIRSRYKEPIPR
jgi:squalene monooxygenase